VKKNKVCGILIIFFILYAVGTFAAVPRTVRVGAFNSFPLIFQSRDGAITGLYVDLLDAIGQKENLRFEYVFGTWQDGLDRIKTGKVDMLTSVGYTDERFRFMDYCHTPLLTTWGELFTVTTSNVNGILQLSGKKISVLKGDIFYKNFRELTAKFGVSCTYVECTSYEDVFKAVNSGISDAGIVDVTFGTAKCRDYNLRSSGIVFNPLDVFFTTLKDKNRDLRKLLDRCLDEWQHQEVSPYSQAKQKWIYGSVGAVPVLPPWLINFLFALGVLIAGGIVFIILLKLQVRRATAEIRQRENLLRSSEARLRTLVQTIPDLIWLKDKDGVYLSCNSMFEHFFGARESDIVGRTDYDFLDRDLADFFREKDRAAMQAGRPTSNEEWITYASSGRQAFLETIKTPMYDDSGVLIGVLGIGREITDRKNAEEKIKSLLSEKELLLREVHHRIKNNMNTIKGLLSLQISSEKNPSIISSLQDAESRVQSMMLLYDKLYCNENYMDMFVDEYLKTLVSEIISIFPNSKTVTTDVDIVHHPFHLNLLTPLGIIVNELLTNIMKYAFVGRTSGKISVRFSISGSHARMEISDDGIGIPETVAFEESTGFGLTLVSMLVVQICGTISIKRGNGTTFILDFNC